MDRRSIALVFLLAGCVSSEARLVPDGPPPRPQPVARRAPPPRPRPAPLPASQPRPAPARPQLPEPSLPRPLDAALAFDARDPDSLLVHAAERGRSGEVAGALEDVLSALTLA